MGERSGLTKEARAWLNEHGLSPADAKRCLVALCTLADLEGQIKAIGHETTGVSFDGAYADVCQALRVIADAWQYGEIP